MWYVHYEDVDLKKENKKSRISSEKGIMGRGSETTSDEIGLEISPNALNTIKV